jgi:hypothetical protein
MIQTGDFGDHLLTLKLLPLFDKLPEYTHFKASKLPIKPEDSVKAHKSPTSTRRQTANGLGQVYVSLFGGLRLDLNKERVMITADQALAPNAKSATSVDRPSITT